MSISIAFSCMGPAGGNKGSASASAALDSEDELEELDLEEREEVDESESDSDEELSEPDAFSRTARAMGLHNFNQ